jgi:hypothetical protein
MSNLPLMLLRRRCRVQLLVMSLLLLPLSVLTAAAREQISYPGDGFVVDVTAAPFNADPSGVEDSSAAILAASEYARTWPVGVPLFVYFPNGRYRIEQPVVLDDRTPRGGYLMMQGQSRDGVVLFVPDNAPAFQNAAAPKSVISYFEGDWTNNGFLNTFENFTIEVGAGNPGAIGLRFQGNNVTRMSDVTIRSLDPDGVGAAGLDLSPSISAPAIVERVRIEGFDTGIKMDNTITSVYSWVLKDIELLGQRVDGIRSHRKPVTIHRLTSVNTVPVFNGIFRDGNVVIFHADLRTPDGESSEGPAIVGKGDFFYLRNVEQSGYGYLFDDNGTRVESTGADGSFRNGPAYKVWEDSPEDFLHLDEVEFPEVAWDAPENWLVLDPAGRSDHTELLREALQSGAETIFLKPGKFTINETVRIGPAVKRIASNFAQLELGAPLTISGAAVFELGVSDQPAVVIEQLWGNWQQNLRNYFIHNRSNADLLLRDVFWISGGAYRNDPAGGRLFVSNVHNVPGGQQFRPDLPSWIIYDQQSYAFQFNPEMALPMLTVSGGSMWIFGAKFGEQQGPMVHTYDQALVEILGGVMNVSHGVELEPMDTPIFVVEDAQLTVSALERAVEINGPTNWNFRHRFISNEVRDGERRQLPTTDPIVEHRDSLSRAGPGNSGALIPLYSSRYAQDGSATAPEFNVYSPQVADLANGAFLIAEIIAANGPGVPSVHWSRVSGPGEIDFADPAAASTVAHFSRVGDYVLGARVRNGLVEAFTTFSVSVTLGERVDISPTRTAFRRLDDRAPRDGVGNAAIEALLLRTGDEAVSSHAQDNEVRIHTEVDVYRLRGAAVQIHHANLRVTPRLVVDPPAIELHHVQGPLFGRVTVDDFLHPTTLNTTLASDVFAVNSPIDFDLTDSLRASLASGHEFMGIQLRGAVNDDGNNNYIEWYSPDLTTTAAYRPRVTVYGDTSGYRFVDAFAGLGGGQYYHPAMGSYTVLGNNWAWSDQLQRFLYIAPGTLTSAWMWTSGGGWLWTSNAIYPWVYHHAAGSWLYAMPSGERSYFIDTVDNRPVSW